MMPRTANPMTNREPQVIRKVRCPDCGTKMVRGSKQIELYNTRPATGTDCDVRDYYCNVCPPDPITGKCHTFKVTFE